MTREELRVFFDDHFCGCGNPPAAAGALLKILEIWHDRDKAMYLEIPKLVQDVGCAWLLLYLIDRHMGIAEHGGGVMASWLEPKGEMILEALRREKTDDFDVLFSAHCIHGYDVSGTNHACESFEAMPQSSEDK